MKKEEFKGMLKSLGDGLALAGVFAIVLAMSWFGATYSVKEETEKECDCGCPVCDVDVVEQNYDLDIE